jgi:hypothetical protein
LFITILLSILKVLVFYFGKTSFRRLNDKSRTLVDWALDTPELIPRFGKLELDKVELVVNDLEELPGKKNSRNSHILKSDLEKLFENISRNSPFCAPIKASCTSNDKHTR